MSKSLVLGFFDGVHRAHRAVIESAFEYSDDVYLLTFKESPAVYFGKKPEYIMSRADSIKKIKNLGIKKVIETDFSEIASISAKDYLKYLVETYKPVSISTGFNHTFGHDRTGNPEFLKKYANIYNYKYTCVAAIKDNNQVISSTLIKKYLKDGQIQEANSLLESNFILEGKVIHGAKIGRTIGFPTANINYPENIVKLPFGVYSAIVDGKKSVMNWGIKPTINNTVEPIIEVHILNFNDDLYDKNIKIDVIKQIRGEQKFKSLEELKIQIQKDIKNA